MSRTPARSSCHPDVAAWKQQAGEGQARTALRRRQAAAHPADRVPPPVCRPLPPLLGAPGFAATLLKQVVTPCHHHPLSVPPSSPRLQSIIQVFALAFLVVGATCIAMVPIMLYMLDLRKYGWEWIHACMFGAMIASTDAVAIVSIMKTGQRHGRGRGRGWARAWRWGPNTELLCSVCVLCACGS